MSGFIIYMAAAALGVDYGWQPVAGGGIEYIIQIEPELLDSLKAGQDLFSDLPPAIRNIRSYRITVGTGRLPHHGEPPPGSNQPSDTTTPASHLDVDHPAVSDIDLSQLPGPILGPALVLQPPGNEPTAEEPPRLAENEATPLANRVAGYHTKPETQAVEEEEHASPGEGQHEQKPSGVEQIEGDRKPTAAAPPAEHATKEEEHDSPSDRLPEVPSATKPALMQLGLFASLCGNAYLVWIATGQRKSYRALVRRMFENRAEDASAVPAGAAGTPRFEQITENEAENPSPKPAQIAS